MSKKKKKEKIIYYDDNSTIADMSRVNKKGTPQQPLPPKTTATFSQQWKTYWSAVKTMFIPMCVVLAVLCVFFLLIMLLSGNLF